MYEHPFRDRLGALSWDLLGSFLAVMRTGSLSGASRSLGVAQPTVRRQIEKLEEVLGAVLFTRSQAGLVPTDTALATMPYAESMAGVAEALVRSATAPSDGERGTVRVTCSDMVACGSCPRYWPRFAARTRSFRSSCRLQRQRGSPAAGRRRCGSDGATNAGIALSRSVSAS
jgi:DNA-binding transcriptional LysR family regulator